MIEAIAHRGLHTKHPENSLGAVRDAVAAGAQGIEVDVHATADGVIVVHHDFAPRGSSDNPELASRPIEDLTAAELESFDIGGGARIPTLSELLSVLGRDVTLYVELKGRNCEQHVATILRDRPERGAVHSFDHRSIRRMAELAPSVRRGVLQGSYMLDNTAALASAAATDLWQHFELIDIDLVEVAHDFGARVIAWTANDPRDWERLARLGADALCTDRLPELIAWRDGGSR